MSSIRKEASLARIGSREDAIQWARSLLSGRAFVVLDSETTGLGTPVDFVEVGVVSSRGETLLDSLICPSCSIEAGASRVHGHTRESLAKERSFFEVYPDLLDVLWEKRVVVYNAPYDRRVCGVWGRGLCLLAVSLPRSAPCVPFPPTWVSGQSGVATRTRSCRAATTRLLGTRGSRCACSSGWLKGLEGDLHSGQSLPEGWTLLCGTTRPVICRMLSSS